MKRKGVCYDVGCVMGMNWRPKFDVKVVHLELEIIKNDLNCNAVRIVGLNMERLMIASEDALKQDWKFGSRHSCGIKVKRRRSSTLQRLL